MGEKSKSALVGLCNERVQVHYIYKFLCFYHSLLMGKPRGGNYHWIDNHVVRATRYTSKFTQLVRRNAEIEVFED